MTDNIVRHLICILISIVCLLAYYSGWISGKNGWWWTSFGILVFYGGIYRLLK